MSNKNDICQTKYPVVLIHGAGFRDRKHFNYWGRIPKALMKNGCSVSYGHQDSWATIEDNASTIKTSIDKVIAETGVKKVNLLAHSKGGLESRYIISSLEMSSKIASLTTIATPHHGSKTMDIICKLPKALLKLVTPRSATWTNFKGVLRETTKRGISHADEVDIRRRRLSGKNTSEHINDICDFYCQIVAELKTMGF